MENIEVLKADINKAVELRNSGRVLTAEEKSFCAKVADRMIAARTMNKAGVQIITKDNVNFVRKYEPSGIVQDAVASGPSAPDDSKKKKTEEVAVQKAVEANGEAKLKESGVEQGKEKKEAKPIDKEKLEIPKNQAEGEPSSTADIDAPAKKSDGSDAKIPTEAIGHNPNEPLPKKMAEDVVNNAKWGVEIGAYTNLKEGIERQLGMKAFAEFVDTPEKYKSAFDFIMDCSKECEPVAVAEGNLKE